MFSNTYTYDSYGKVTASTGNVANPYQYAGRDNDVETGLRYYRSRYYDPGAGRFLTEDPLRFLAGYNFYQYAAGNPLSFADPFGLCIVDVFFNPVIRWGRTLGYHAYIVVTDNVQRSKYPVTEFSGGENDETGTLNIYPASSHFPDDMSQAAASMNVVHNDCSCRRLLDKFQSVADTINNAQIPYHTLTTNSNAAVTTILQHSGVAYQPMPVWAPGWGQDVLGH